MSSTREAAFPGFPEGRVRVTLVPDLFFSALLPDIDDLAELKVTLHVLWAVTRSKRPLPGLSLSELRDDPTLTASLRSGQGSLEEGALEAALERAVQRGSLLRVTASGEGRQDHYYFVNSPRGRDAVDRVTRGLEALTPAASPTEPSGSNRRTNIFELYEQNVGLLQPIIVEELKEAEQMYPMAWIEEAFLLAARANARNWRYVRSILDRWAREGKN